MFELVRSIRIEAERALGVAEIAADHPALIDHFPGRPVVPGTWLLELSAQIAGPLAEEVARARHGLDRWAILAMIHHAKLIAPLAPPATIRIEATITRCDHSTATVHVAAHAGDVLVVRCELVFAMIDAPAGSEAAGAARRERLARWKATS